MLPANTDSTDCVAPATLDGVMRLPGDIRGDETGALELDLHRDPNPRCRVTQTLRALPDGSLVIEGCDAGALVEEMHGADEYEYRVTLGRDDTARLLLLLVAERFRTLEDARRWFERKGLSPAFRTGF